MWFAYISSGFQHLTAEYNSFLPVFHLLVQINIFLLENFQYFYFFFPISFIILFSSFTLRLSISLSLIKILFFYYVYYFRKQYGFIALLQICLIQYFDIIQKILDLFLPQAHSFGFLLSFISSGNYKIYSLILLY